MSQSLSYPGSYWMSCPVLPCPVLSCTIAKEASHMACGCLSSKRDCSKGLDPGSCISVRQPPTRPKQQASTLAKFGVCWVPACQVQNSVGKDLGRNAYSLRGCLKLPPKGIGTLGTWNDKYFSCPRLVTKSNTR